MDRFFVPTYAFQSRRAERRSKMPVGHRAAARSVLLEDQEKLRALRLAELQRLAEEGRASGLSEEDGETVLDRLDAKYRAMIDRREA